jgi:hypothetical protein
MDVGAGLRQRREIADQILPDAGVCSGKGQDHRARSHADQSAGFETADLAGLVQNERRDGCKRPYLSDRFDGRRPVRLVGELRELHQCPGVAEFETLGCRCEVLKRMPVVFTRRDFDEAGHAVSLPRESRRREHQNSLT